MNRKERTRILVEGSRKVLSRMACEAEQLYAVAMVREPTEELVMLKVREGAQCSLFYLGEALMTSCAVRIGGAHGYGMVLGEDRKKARDLAIVDAVYAVGGNEILLLAWKRCSRKSGSVWLKRSKSARRRCSVPRWIFRRWKFKDDCE